MGTTCEVIAQWAKILEKALHPASVVYADANHHPEPKENFHARWTDNQHAVQLDVTMQSDIINRHLALAQTDAGIPLDQYGPTLVQQKQSRLHAL